MIKLEKVSKRLKTFSLKNLSFELPAGYICGLIGENGSGKSTLIEALAVAYGFNAEGGTLNYNFSTYAESHELASAMSVRSVFF